MAHNSTTLKFRPIKTPTHIRANQFRSKFIICKVRQQGVTGEVGRRSTRLLGVAVGMTLCGPVVVLSLHDPIRESSVAWNVNCVGFE